MNTMGFHVVVELFVPVCVVGFATLRLPDLKPPSLYAWLSSFSTERRFYVAIKYSCHNGLDDKGGSFFPANVNGASVPSACVASYIMTIRQAV